MKEKLEEIREARELTELMGSEDKAAVALKGLLKALYEHGSQGDEYDAALSAAEAAIKTI